MTKNKRVITIEVWDKNQRKHVKAHREGQLFTVSGADLLLFPVRVLAEAIDRDVATIYRWERSKVWPASMWNVKGDKRTKRWYSAAQIHFAADLYKRLAGQDRGYSQSAHGMSHSKHFPLGAFLKGVRDNFYKVDARSVHSKEQRP